MKRLDELLPSLLMLSPVSDRAKLLVGWPTLPFTSVPLRVATLVFLLLRFQIGDSIPLALCTLDTSCLDAEVGGEDAV